MEAVESERERINSKEGTGAMAKHCPVADRLLVPWVSLPSPWYKPW